MSQKCDPQVFRAYDIRGKAGTQITPALCRAIGAAFGAILRERTGKESPQVAVGRDARISSPDLERALIEGLLQSGCAVFAIGQTPSPVNYFTVCARALDGGAHVTASHNSWEDNGIKLCARDAEAFAGGDIQELRRRCMEEPAGRPSRLAARHGEVRPSRSERATNPCTPLAPQGDTAGIEDSYTSFLLSRFPAAGQGLRVVIDAGNGVAGPLYVRILRAAGCAVTELYTEPDGRFPNHPADPSKHETLRDLQAAVLREQAHIGLAFDGDGDRLGIIDDTGRVSSADHTLLLLAQDHLRRNPKGKVVFTVSNSGIIPTEVARWGGTPVMCPVGHSSVEHAMRAHGALLGGEQSGHFFCAENYFPFDDALVAALRVLRILRNAGKPLSVLLDAFPKVYQAPERRPRCPDERKAVIIARVKEHFLTTFPVETMDGVRIDFGEGSWAGIRQSNTSPCISVCMEARTPEKLQEVESAILGHLRQYPEIQW